MPTQPIRPVLALLTASLLVPAAALVRGADWPDWRGPARTGVSTEKNLVNSWSPARREPRVAGAVWRPLGAGRVR